MQNWAFIMGSLVLLQASMLRQQTRKFIAAGVRI
jgi:hypothetical protein